MEACLSAAKTISVKNRWLRTYYNHVSKQFDCFSYLLRNHYFCSSSSMFAHSYVYKSRGGKALGNGLRIPPCNYNFYTPSNYRNSHRNVDGVLQFKTYIQRMLNKLYRYLQFSHPVIRHGILFRYIRTRKAEVVNIIEYNLWPTSPVYKTPTYSPLLRMFIAKATPRYDIYAPFALSDILSMASGRVQRATHFVPRIRLIAVCNFVAAMIIWSPGCCRWSYKLLVIFFKHIIISARLFQCSHYFFWCIFNVIKTAYSRVK